MYSNRKGGLVSISTEFRVSIQFPIELKTYIGAPVFEEEELIYAGDSSTLDITLVDAEGFVSKLHKGLDFEILDNSGTINWYWDSYRSLFLKIYKTRAKKK